MFTVQLFPVKQRYPLLGSSLRHLYISVSLITFNVFLLELNKNPVEGFSAGLIDDNDLYRWEVLIIGPPDTL